MKHLISLTKLFIILSLISLIRLEQTPKFILLHGQSSMYKYLMWEEINSNKIIFSKILPLVEPKISWKKIDKFYKNWHNIPHTPISIRLNAELNQNYNDKLREYLYGTVLVDLSKHLFIQNNFEFDSNGWDDDHFRQGQNVQSIGDWTGYLQHSSLTFRYNNSHLLIGKGNIYSSIFNNSLIINQHSPPVEFIWWHHNRDKLNIDWSMSSLDSINDINRLLILNRYAYKADKYCFGFSEIAIISYLNLNGNHLKYMIPTAILFETEVNGGQNSNLMWAFDFTLKYKKYTMIGEFLIDDYSLDNQSPHKIGYKFGVGSQNKYFSYYVEYNHINRWVGNYFDPELRYINNKVLIGHPLGPDAHSLVLQLFKIIDEHIYTNISFSYIESGNSNINDWPEGIGNSANFGYNSEPFPSSPATEDYVCELFVEYYINPHLSSKISLALSTLISSNLGINIKYSI